MKKQEQKTDAQLLFEGKELLTARPPDMGYEEYKFLRKTQSLILKHLFKHKPDKKLQNIMGVPSRGIFGKTTRGVTRRVIQRKAN